MDIPPNRPGEAFQKSNSNNNTHYARPIRRLLIFILTAGMILISPARSYAEKSLSALETLNVDPTTGTANLSIPIEVPPGRGGIQPSVNLFYNSGSPNGKLGMGWNLELGNIQRSVKRGAPQYDSSDTFILVQSGSSQELVYNASTGKYQPQTAASRQDDPANSTRVFKWCLDKKEDIISMIP